MIFTQQSALLILLGWRQIYEATADWISLGCLHDVYACHPRAMKRRLDAMHDVFPLEYAEMTTTGKNRLHVRRIPDAG